MDNRVLRALQDLGDLTKRFLELKEKNVQILGSEDLCGQQTLDFNSWKKYFKLTCSILSHKTLLWRSFKLYMVTYCDLKKLSELVVHFWVLGDVFQILILFWMSIWLCFGLYEWVDYVVWSIHFKNTLFAWHNFQTSRFGCNRSWRMPDPVCPESWQ